VAQFRREPLHWYPGNGDFRATWWADGRECELRLEAHLVRPYLESKAEFLDEEPDVGWCLLWENQPLHTWRSGILDDYESPYFTPVGAMRVAESFRYERDCERRSHGWRRPFWRIFDRIAWSRHSTWLDKHCPAPRESHFLTGRASRPEASAAQWERMLNFEAKARLMAQGAQSVPLSIY
jgi:hypothetical protein